MRHVSLVSMTLLLLVPRSFAQTTFATITGNVTDPSGLSVAGAKVAGVHVQTGYKYEATSNESGVYTLANLKEGTYNVDVTAPGFRPFHARSLELVSRDNRRLDVR